MKPEYIGKVRLSKRGHAILSALRVLWNALRGFEVCRWVPVLVLTVALGGCAIQNDAAVMLNAANALSVDVLACAVNNPTLPGMAQMVADANANLAAAVKVNATATAWPTPEQFAADTALAMQTAEDILAFILKYFPGVIPLGTEQPRLAVTQEATPQALNAKIMDLRVRAASKKLPN
jgi:hypothetical protein